MNREDARAYARGKGPLAWMAANPVASNLLMAVLMVGGLIIGSQVKQEVFPEFDMDVVLVNVVYPGASPSEVEKGVILAIEEQIRGLDGVKEVRSTATEGMGLVTIELLLGVNANKVLSDVKSAVDRIQSFPQDIERPVVSLVSNRREVISLVIYGDLPERVLRGLAEEAREKLLQDPNISQVDLGAVRPYEISVEVPSESLRRYGLTLDTIAGQIRAASVETPGGGVKTPSGEVLLRTTERRETGSEFENISLISQRDGSTVRLGDIAHVVDGFQETDQEAFFNGMPAALVKVYRVGDQTPIAVAAAVKETMETMRKTVPEGVHLATWGDSSEVYRDRIDLLRRNGIMGLILVLLTLALFLESRLAFWVTMGIPISFLGSMLMLPSVGVSINMISLFAFIVTLGIVVDDAIVVGEAIYHRRQEGVPLVQAAIEGSKEVAMPVVFSVLTTVMAFSPLLFVPGIMGKFFRNVPWVVIVVLLVSLIESLFILPAHLSHQGGRLHQRFFGPLLHALDRVQRFFDAFLGRFIHGVYEPFARRGIRWRYFTLACGVAVLLGAFGIVAGGRISFTFMPKIDSDRVMATLELPFGTSVDDTRRHIRRIEALANRIIEDNGGQAISRGVFSQVGGTSAGLGGPGGGAEASASHVGQVTVYMVPTDQRPISASAFAHRWREAVGQVPGVESLTFQYSTGPGATKPIDVELSHPDTTVLERAASDLAARLAEFAGVVEVDDGFKPGKEQLDFTLTDAGRALGITESEMARQLRSAFFGALAVRQQRGRDEVRTYVRLPRSERESEHDVEALLLRTPQGGEIPLGQAGKVTRGRAYTEIIRVDGRRVVNVTADVAGKTSANVIMGEVMQTIAPELEQRHGVTVGLGGEQRNQAEALQALKLGFLMGLLGIFALLAIPLRSYLQPAVIMTAIPFGLVGALAGHLLLGYDLSLISMMGIVALSGVVVNDSLVLVVAINEFRAEGMSPLEAVIAGGTRRFRPIMLTSMTTFFGLLPMILETSVQARFLIPMAISLAFGILFSTIIVLLFVPALYMILQDFHARLTHAGDSLAGVKATGEGV